MMTEWERDVVEGERDGRKVRLVVCSVVDLN